MILEIKDLKFRYKGNTEMQFPDVQLKRGETLLILGNSGKGKTTLLHLMAGLLSPSEGTIHINQTNLNDLKGHRLDRFRGNHMGIVFQKSYFLKGLSSIQNVQVAALAAEQKQDLSYIHELFKNLGLTGKELKKTYQLSIGEQQRVNIIRALVNKPDVLLADEPTSALDDKHCMDVVDALKTAASFNNSALVIVTHDHRLKDVFKNVIEL